MEFALIAPMMVAIFFGLKELSLIAGRQSVDVYNLASVGADLIAQETTRHCGRHEQCIQRAGATLYPYPTTRCPNHYFQRDRQ